MLNAKSWKRDFWSIWPIKAIFLLVSHSNHSKLESRLGSCFVQKIARHYTYIGLGVEPNEEMDFWRLIQEWF